MIATMKKLKFMSFWNRAPFQPWFLRLRDTSLTRGENVFFGAGTRAIVHILVHRLPGDEPDLKSRLEHPVDGVPSEIFAPAFLHSHAENAASQQVANAFRGHATMARLVPSPVALQDSNAAGGPCVEMVEEPTIVAMPRYLYHFGHFLGDGFTPMVYAAAKALADGMLGSPRVLLGSATRVIFLSESLPRFRNWESMRKHWEFAFAAISSRPVIVEMSSTFMMVGRRCYRDLTLASDSRLTHYYSNMDSLEVARFSAFIRSALQLPTQLPPLRLPMLLLINRPSTAGRRILNADQLLAVARKHVYCEEVQLEHLTIREVVTRLSLHTSILVGVDGTGLLNSYFLRPGTTLIHIMTLKSECHGGNFDNVVSSTGGFLLHVNLPNATCCIDAASSATTAEHAYDTASAAQRREIIAKLRDFNIIVPLEAFERAVMQAMTTSLNQNAKRRL